MVGGWPWHGRGGRLNGGGWLKVRRGLDGGWGSLDGGDVGHEGLAEVEVLQEGS